MDKATVIGLLRYIYSIDIKSALPDALNVQQNDLFLKELSCVDGNFSVNVVYAAHPADSKYYIRIADFHSYLLQDKRAEFVRLAASLGAKEIKLVDSKENSTGGKGSAYFKEPTSIADIGVDVGVNKISQDSFSLSAKFPVATKPPAIPNKLRWYWQEPLWQEMAEARMNRWLGEFNVRFTYSQDFNITSNLVAKISGLGLNAGGSFTDIQKVDQEYIVEFFPQTDYPTY